MSAVSATPPLIVRDLRAGDEAATVEVLVASFTGFPVLQVVVGTDDAAPERLRRIFSMELEPDSKVKALVAELDGRIVGALTYADSPACSTMSVGRTLRFLRIVGTRFFGALRVLGRVERAHPGTPHRHLPSLGVDPSLQGSGIGEQLMRRYNEGCDEIGLDGYLETIRWVDQAQPSHERFYGRQGFVVVDVLPVTDDWSILTMRRPSSVSSSD